MKRLSILVVVAAFVGSFTVPVHGQSALIQAALQNFVRIAHTWTATQTFTTAAFTNTVTVAAAGSYGFTGVSNALGLNGTATALRASDGGNYFYVGVGQVLANSADLVLASAGAVKVVFPTTANDGMLAITNSVKTIGTTIKVDALPTVSSCGAGSPAVVAGSTPFAGSVTIGTTSVATCTITFGGTAFPSAPHCTGSVETSTAANTRAMGYVATTTAVTIVPSAAWVDSSVVNWTCISSK